MLLKYPQPHGCAFQINGLRVVSFIDFVPSSEEGRENRPQLRCGNTLVRSSISSRFDRKGAQPIRVSCDSGEGGTEAVRAEREVTNFSLKQVCADRRAIS